MEEILKEVLLKQVANKLHDKVLIVENLPSRFLYEQTRKMIQRIDRDGYPDGTQVVDPSGELVWTLRPGLAKSQNGDGGIVFDMMERESKDRLADITRFIEMSYSRDQRIPEFIDNAQQIGNPMTGPLPYFQIPKVTLPAPIAPSVPVFTQTVTAAASVQPAVVINSPAPAPTPPETRTRQEPAGLLSQGKMTPERKEELRARASARMKKMHEDRKKARMAAA